MKKGEAPMHKNFKSLNMKMDSLAKKVTSHDVCFVVWGVQDLFPVPLMSVQLLTWQVL